MVDKILYQSRCEEWETPQDLYDELNKEFNFVLDPCATKENAKCANYITKERDGLSYPWTEFDGAVFVNPPYGREVGKWIQKAKEESNKGITVVCLVYARTDTKWFHDYCLDAEIRFIKGRIKFGEAKYNAPAPSMLVIFRRKDE